MENEHAKTNEKPDVEQHIQIDEQTAYNLKILEFDKLIAEAENNVSSLKNDKAKYIYEAHVNIIVYQHQMKQQQNIKSSVSEINQKEKISEETIPQKIPAKEEKSI